MALVSVFRPGPANAFWTCAPRPVARARKSPRRGGRRALLVSNEPVPSRAKILSRNIERMGVPNALVVCAQPEALAALGRPV